MKSSYQCHMEMSKDFPTASPHKCDVDQDTLTHPPRISHSKHVVETSVSLPCVTSLASPLDVETRCLALCHPYVQEGMKVAEFQCAVVMEQATGDQGRGA